MQTSLTGKSWLVQEPNNQAAKHLAECLHVDRAVAGILDLRGIRTCEEGEAFLDGSLSRLTNPREVAGIPAAADRIIRAIDGGERICVYGDYDVDGVTATSLMVLILKRLGAEVFYFIPHRTQHGYGLHPEAIAEIKEGGADLLITVDNGIGAVEEVALARSLGMDVIITDHHEPPERLPETPYLINPKVCRPGSDDDRPVDALFVDLSGVGLAFCLMVAVRAAWREQMGHRSLELPNLREYLDLVALGTIGDVVPLSGENRILVKQGLREIPQSRNPGVKALLRASGLKGPTVTPGQVGFVLAPRINAAGRIGSAELALRLLVSSDESEVDEVASILNRENLKRQEIEKEIFDQALEQYEEGGGKDGVIVLHSDAWHPGVIGIVASRMVERFYRPTIMITRRNGMGTGSGRSIPGFSLYEALDACRADLQRFGGHRMAAGLTLDWEQIEQFRENINHYADQVLNETDFIPRVKVDGILQTGEIDDSLLHSLDKLQPYGMGNPEPVFMTQNVPVMHPRPVGEDHVRFQIPRQGKPLNVIGFHWKEPLGLVKEDEPVDLLYRLRFNEFRGVRSIQAVLVDVRRSET